MVDVVEILVQCGADPGSTATNMLPVHVTVLNNDLKYCVLDICLLLCGKNASVPHVQCYCVFAGILVCDRDNTTLWDNAALWWGQYYFVGQCCFVVGTILQCVLRNSTV